jgi:TPR repeat protein
MNCGRSFWTALRTLLTAAAAGWGCDTEHKPSSKYMTISDDMDSAARGDLAAQVRLGWAYALGKGVEQDHRVAAFWFKKAAAAGDPDGQFNLGVAYEHGEGVEMDLARAARYYEQAATQGLAVAQFNLANCYRDGIGVSANTERAIELFELAARQGHRNAAYNLAFLLDSDDHEQNLLDATQWYTCAADSGDPEAQVRLAWMLETGHGVPKDESTAIHWYTLASEQNNATAQVNLGAMYADGRGVERDLRRAMALYTLAVEQDSAEAFVAIGLLYEIGGPGIMPDLSKAAAYYLEAANRGSIDGMFNLAEKYERGQGLPRDMKMALAWYISAANAGDREARTAYERLRRIENGDVAE